MNMNDGTLYRRVEDLVFICDSMEAALDMASEARTTVERQKAETESVSEDGVPPLDIIPELAVVEGNNSDEHYSNAP